MKIARKADDHPSSAEIVASIDDLLITILLRLPIRSLICFKIVSKHWLSLITTPRFSLLRSPNHSPAIGMFVPRDAFRANAMFKYVHFDTKNPCNPPFRKLMFREATSRLRILQSCNGLFLCSTYRTRESDCKYYVLNPTTKQLTILPDLSNNRTAIYSVNLAFEPSKSPHYKAVYITGSDLIDLIHGPYQVRVYSSETGPLRISGEPFSTHIDFATGVYWKGSIHWIDPILYSALCYGYSNERQEQYNTSLYYDIEHETLGKIPMPPGLIGWENGMSVAYFGESCDHLHFIKRFVSEIKFNVYEMKRDFSGWFVKYEVDLTPITLEFPEMITLTVNGLEYDFSIFTLIRGKDDADADSFLVLQIPEKAIRYNITSKTFEKLCDIDGIDINSTLPYPIRKAYGYIESLYCV